MLIMDCSWYKVAISVHVLIWVVCVATMAEAFDKDVSKLSEANIKLSINLYKRLVSDKNVHNVIFSPISISAAMAMTHLGAKGATANQISEAFMFGNVDDKQFHSDFGKLHGSMFNKQSENVTLKSSNRVFANKNFNILDEYRKSLTVYDAAVDQMNFADSIAAVGAINKWVEENTMGKITSLLSEGSIDASTALLLANTVYFKGDWHAKFPASKTEKRPFFVSQQKIVDTPFMFQRGRFRFGYLDDLSVQILEMPYSGQDFNMVVLLPDEVNLEVVEKSLNYENLTTWLGTLNYRNVEVTIPKFKLEETLHLHKILPSIGVIDVFSREKSDLSGISLQTEGLFVDQVLHKSVLEVDEQGSVAAAATTVRLVARSIDMRPRFVADHPFLWAIMHAPTGHVVFMGRLVQPSGEVVTFDRDEL